MLNEEGLLSVGVHDLTLVELRSTFGAFNGTDRRCRLFDKLSEYISKVADKPWFRALLVDGSFVTAKLAPSDIDLIVVVDAAELPEDHLIPADYNLLSRRRAARLYGFDVIMAVEGSASLAYWVSYFSQVKGSNKRKGLVRLTP
jgi:Family of unknown function (DUF6932)